MPDTSTGPETEVTGATTVVVRFCAPDRALAGVARLRADLHLEWLPLEPLVAVNRDYADMGQRLAAGDEVALIPPVSGG